MDDLPTGASRWKIVIVKLEHRDNCAFGQSSDAVSDDEQNGIYRISSSIPRGTTHYVHKAQQTIAECIVLFIQLILSSEKGISKQ
jgi:hypothetical protein